MSSSSEHGLELKLDARSAIWTSIEELQEQFNVSKSNAERSEINQTIRDLMAQLSALRAVSIQVLNNSHQVKQTVADIQSVTQELNNEAANVKSVTDALNKGSALVAKATKLVAMFAGISTPTP